MAWKECEYVPLGEVGVILTSPFFPMQEVALKSLGSEGLFLFSSLDTNNDLYLSPEEFKPIAEKLTGAFLPAMHSSLCTD